MANTEEMKNPAITKFIEKAKTAGVVSDAAISELIDPRPNAIAALFLVFFLL